MLKLSSLAVLVGSTFAAPSSSNSVGECNTAGTQFSYNSNSEKGVDWSCAECASGKEQSPIDIVTDNIIELPRSLRIHYHFYDEDLPGTFSIKNGNVRWETDSVESDNWIPFFGESITGILKVAEEFSCDEHYGDLGILQLFPTVITIHTPSEHTLDGKRYAMELQMHAVVPDAVGCDIDMSPENCTTVTSILYTTDEDAGGADDIILGKLIEGVEEWPTDYESTVTASFNLKDLVNEEMSYYSYIGSSTQPPCTETFVWHVMAQPRYISQDVVDIVQGAVAAVNAENEFNARVTQELNGRAIFFYDWETQSDLCLAAFEYVGDHWHYPYVNEKESEHEHGHEDEDEHADEHEDEHADEHEDEHSDENGEDHEEGEHDDEAGEDVAGNESGAVLVSMAGVSAALSGLLVWCL